MQISPINQNNQNFKAAHMSWITALNIGFPKRRLFKQCPDLKEAADIYSLVIKASPEYYQLTRLPSNQVEKAGINFLGSVLSAVSGFWGLVGISTAVSLSGLLGFIGGVAGLCYCFPALIENMTKDKETKSVQKIIIQAGEGYENGELQGKKSSEITTNYEALNELSLSQLIPTSKYPRKVTFEPDTIAQDLYKWHIERKPESDMPYFSSRNSSSGDYYWTGAGWGEY